MQSLVDIYRNALDVMRDGEGWTTEHLAQDDAFNEVHPKDAKACRFCISGALLNAAPDVPCATIALEFLRVEVLHNEAAISMWNDSPARTWPEVRTLLLTASCLAAA